MWFLSQPPWCHLRKCHVNKLSVEVVLILEVILFKLTTITYILVLRGL